MVVGVSEGFTKNLVISGVGYKASVSGSKLVMNLGFSHQVEVAIPSDLKVTCPSATEIQISGIDKQKVGQFASNIKDIRPVEPYHGYGVRYADEVVIRKVGKTAGKGKK
jgi:large subunit ribosomal protein L6